MTSDVRFIVRQYIGEGWSVIPIPRGSKAPTEKDWVNRSFTEADFEAESNIGVRLGEPSGHLIDVDLDVPEAVRVAPALLLNTERIHGRPTTGASHYWYICDAIKKTEQFKDVDGKVIAEIRSTGGQTVLPPSLHPSGELLYWEHDRSPSRVDAAGLRRAVRNVATSALLARHWPKGSRHVAARDAAGFLAARELDPREIEEIIRGAAQAAGDDEVEDRARVARDTARTFAAGGKTTGAPTLEACVGKDVIAVLLKWYGGNTSKHDGIIEELNKKHFVVRVGKDVVIGTEEEDEVVFQHEKALHLLYANQLVLLGTRKKRKQEGEDEAKEEPIVETKFSLWKKHPRRREFRSLTFAPPPCTPHQRDYNLWKGFAVQPLPLPESLVGQQATSTDVQEWLGREVRPRCVKYLSLIHDVICAGEPARQEEYYEYLLDLMALTCQRPGEPSEVAVVLKGERGTGKGQYVRNFGSLFGRHFAHIAKPEQVVGKFNAMCSGKVVIFADEAFFAGDKRDLGALKVLITEPTLAVERKGIDPIQEPNFVHLFMASNEDWHTPAGMQERRFFALSVSDVHQQDSEYFDPIVQEMKTGGREALLTYLLWRPIDDNRRRELRRAPRTDELRVQQERTLPWELQWWKERLTTGELGPEGGWPSSISPSDMYRDYITWCDVMKINRRVTLVDMCRRVLDPWLGARVRHQGKWVRDIKRLSEARELFDQKAGTKTPWEGEEANAPSAKKGEADIPF